jgi:hypothetical protein
MKEPIKNQRFYGKSQLAVFMKEPVDSFHERTNKELAVL